MENKTTSLERLLELSSLLISTLELEPLLTKILKTAEEFMAADASSVMLLDSDKNELYYEVALGVAGEQIKEQKRIKVGTGIAGWVAENKKSLHVKDAYKDSRFFSDFDKMTGFKTRNILCQPLLIREKLIGVAQIINKKNNQDFSDYDEYLFSKYCEISAIAIDNALMHKKMIEQDRLQRDLQLAEEIQKTFLPKEIPKIKNLYIDYRSLACRHVGGDLLDLQTLPDGKLSVLLGDVSGKGVPAALFSAKLASDFEHLLSQNQNLETVMLKLNNRTEERSTRGMFVTAVYAVCDGNNGKVQIINAGHLAPIILGPDLNQVQILDIGNSPPLGIIKNLSFSCTEIQLEKGQTLLLMTDGATDVLSPKGERLNQSLILESIKKSPSLALANLMKLISDFKGNTALPDDITLAAINYGDHSQLQFSSETTHLSTVRKLIEEKANLIGFDERTTNQINIAITEAIANIIKHTYKMSPNGKIQITISARPKSIEFHLKDLGPKQNPSLFRSRDLAEVRPGGIGVHFIENLMDTMLYDDSLSEGNELHLIKKFGDS